MVDNVPKYIDWLEIKYTHPLNTAREQVYTQDKLNENKKS